MILAGDIGGTNTRIALFEPIDNKLSLVQEQVYPSRDHHGLSEIVQLFMRDHPGQINAASFGIAGPIINQAVSTPNLPWVINGAQLSEQTGIKQLSLINDLQAHASGVGDLEAGGFCRAQPSHVAARKCGAHRCRYRAWRSRPLLGRSNPPRFPL